ncbi:hypothetical protein MOMA_05195 [Moraxella macacae 0408225]|uniref:Uncharacterized protein n=1 Tax=Moraxella macacae 0408225 TaxID=1230338 RepID=L2FAI2_9GAMM|nr:hypothetical protein MOMA_05195 [Moraxella macacae 0408225]
MIFTHLIAPFFNLYFVKMLKNAKICQHFVFYIPNFNAIYHKVKLSFFNIRTQQQKNDKFCRFS